MGRSFYKKCAAIATTAFLIIAPVGFREDADWIIKGNAYSSETADMSSLIKQTYVYAAKSTETVKSIKVPKSAKSSKNKKVVTVKKAKKNLKVKSGKYIYQITKVAKKKSTVTVLGLTKKAKKKTKKIVIPKAIKIKSKKGKNKGTYKYKVIAISKKAFKNNKKITSVKIGANVKAIGDQAFAGCINLKNVVLGKSVKTIGKSAFSGCKNLSSLKYDAEIEIQKIEKNAFVGTKISGEDLNKLKKIAKTNEEKANEEKEEDDGSYKYEIIPLMEPFNSYFYIKTKNPDPDSFRFIDKDTAYSEDSVGSITPVTTKFMDVKYEDDKTLRVKGGYIASGSNTDGGTLYLQERKVVGSHNVYNISTGETTTEKDYENVDTDVTVQTANVCNVVDYLINKYGYDSKEFFDNLTTIQNGFSKECLYSGVYVLGDQEKSENYPYYGLSTSPHVDQTFYIQDPYYRTDSKAMLVSYLYPMKYDSIGFPSIMWSVAEKLNSGATICWSENAHYLVNVTYNGETKSYGGQGLGGGQGINADQIKYYYSFDNSANDAYAKRTLSDVKRMITYYGNLTVPETPKDLEPLTWGQVKEKVGEDGSYVKLTLITSIFGGITEGYTFLYDNTDIYGDYGSIGYFSNVWYDGRYINKYEYYYPGATFADTVEKTAPGLVFKNVKIKLPDDGKDYYYNYKKLSETGLYDEESGFWKGFMTYTYDAENKVWKAKLLNNLTYKEGGSYQSITDEEFINACTITMDEALEMNLDKNTDVEPGEYYYYDRLHEPGSKYEGE